MIHGEHVIALLMITPVAAQYQRKLLDGIWGDGCQSGGPCPAGTIESGMKKLSWLEVLVERCIRVVTAGRTTGGSTGTACHQCWPAQISCLSLAATVPLAVVAPALSVWLGLKLHRRLLAAAAGCAFQLIIAAALLTPIMLTSHTMWVALYVVAASAIAAAEAASRPPYVYQGEFVHLLLGFVSVTAAVLAYAIGFILPSVWWGDPRCVVPAAIVALAPTVICVDVGLSAAFTSLVEGQAHVEQWLAFGASRQEAGGAAVRAGMEAALERLVALTGGPGLLLLPPLAAGLVLAGLPLMQVAAYEMVLSSVVAACCVLVSCFAVVAATGSLVDGAHRLRLDLLVERPAVGSGGWLAAEITQAWRTVTAASNRGIARLRIVVGHRGGFWLRRHIRGDSSRPVGVWGGRDSDALSLMSAGFREALLGTSEGDESESVFATRTVDGISPRLSQDPMPNSLRGTPVWHAWQTSPQTSRAASLTPHDSEIKENRRVAASAPDTNQCQGDGSDEGNLGCGMPSVHQRLLPLALLPVSGLKSRSSAAFAAAGPAVAAASAWATRWSTKMVQFRGSRHACHDDGDTEISSGAAIRCSSSPHTQHAEPCLQGRPPADSCAT